MATGSLYGTSSESTGLYGIGAASGGTYFEWFIFQDSATAPATPTGGSWSFSTNTGTTPAGWLNAPPAAPVNQVWLSIAVVDSRNVNTFVWSIPGLMTGSGLPILSASGVPSSGTGLNGQLYINTATTPQSMYFKQTGAWTQLTGSTLYATAGANSNITSLSGLTGGISTADFVQFDTGITPTTAVGKFQWDPDSGGPQIGMTGGNVNLQIGQEQVVYVYNDTGSQINEGQIVKITGAQGQRVTVALAQANNDGNSATILGMATENIANNSSGFITTQGIVNNVNTSGFLEGAIVYLSPTTPGAFTATKPVAPNHLVLVGYIVKGGSGGAGSVFIHPQNGYELSELHDVLITSVANNNLLRYNSAVPAWVNIAGPSGTIVGTSDTQTLTNKSISGASNTLTNIPNSALVNDSVSVNGVDLTLGAVQLLGADWVLPDYDGNAGKVLAVNTSASDVQWISAGGVGTVTSVDVSGGTTGLTTFNGPITAAGTITLAGTLALTNGGTGQTTANAAFNALAPSQTGNNGKYLTTNGTDTSWAANPLGTVTSVGGTGTVSGITLSGTVTSSGNLTLGGTLDLSSPPAIGGTTAASGAFTTLSASNNVTLSSGTANGVPYLNGSKVLTSGSALTFDGNVFGVSPAIGVTAKTKQLVLNNFSGEGVGITFSRTTDDTEVNAIGTANSNWDLGVFARDNIIFATGGNATYSATTEQMRLTSTGLGIGTSSPGARLAIGDTSTTTSNQIRLHGPASGTAGGASINVVNGTNTIFAAGNVSNIIGGAYSSDAMLFWNNAALRFYDGVGGERMRLDSSGNLGLGVTPSAWYSSFKGFDLSAAGAVSGSANGAILWANSYINASASERYKTNGYAVKYVAASDIGAHIWQIAPSGTAGNAISFTQAMTLDASGNLGIGTSSPAAKLHVYNNAGGAIARLQSAAPYAYPGDFSLVAGGFESPGFGIYDNTAATTRLALVDGNLGLGVTPSAWGGGYTGLQVRNSFSIWAASGTSAYLSRNVFYDGTSRKYVFTGAAAEYELGAGTHTWYTAPSGTAGDAISFTQAMTLDAYGYLSVGTTSALGSNSSSTRGIVCSNGSSDSLFSLGVNGTYTGVMYANASQVLMGSYANVPLVLATNNTERARIDSSGNLLVGRTSISSTPDVGFNIGQPTTGTYAAIGHANGTSSGQYYIGFTYNGTNIGSITQSGTTAVAYNTSSDYRLKNITGPVTTSGAYIDSLNPVEGTWKADGSTFVGLIAHEAQEVSRTQVATGTKDGEEMQGMDYSSAEIIANLIAELQSVRQRLAAAGIA